MEHPEKPNTASGVAEWFAGPLAPMASAHACVDNRQVVLCVRAEDVAWAAPGANRDGYHIEHAGYANQTGDAWVDDYSLAMLKLSAEHAASICAIYDIPAKRLTVEEVRDGKSRGFCGHCDVTEAFGKSNHTDPGPNFPWDTYIGLVRWQLEGLLTGEELDARDTEPPDVPEGVPV